MIYQTSENKINLEENQFSLMRQKSTLPINLLFPKIGKSWNKRKGGEYNTIVNIKKNQKRHN